MQRIATALAALTLCAAASAQTVTITEPWVRGTTPQQKASGLFMHIEARQDVRLVAGSSPVAGAVEIHEMVMRDNVMQMRELPQGLPIAKDQTLELKPGSYHVMLMQLKQQLKPGETVPVTLTFEHQADATRFTQEIAAPVKALANKGHAHDPGKHEHGKQNGHGNGNGGDHGGSKQHGQHH